MNNKAMRRRARERAIQAQQQTPSQPIPQQVNPAGLPTAADYASVEQVPIHTQGEARVVPNSASSHMRAKAQAGAGNVRDHDPTRLARELQEATGTPADPAFQQAGAGNVRPHLPQGSPNVRTVAQPRGSFGRTQPHVRDANLSSSGAIRDPRGSIADVNSQVPPGVGGYTQIAPNQMVPQQFAPQQMPQQQMQANPSPEAAAPAGPVPMALGPSLSGNEPADLTIIITTFRRPHLLRPQLQALAQQSVRASQIWIWCNDQMQAIHDLEAESHYMFVRSKINLGPWPRFALAVDTTTKYVAILDDDCLPGPGWIEAAITHLEEMESSGETAVICAEGRVFQGDDPSKYAEVSASSPSTEQELVDEGMKGWIFRRDLGEIFNLVPRPPNILGWGLHFAASLSSEGIFQIVLPYDPERKTWGALPVPDDGASLSRNLPGYADFRREAWNFYREVMDWAPLALMDQESEGDPIAADDPAESPVEPG